MASRQIDLRSAAFGALATLAAMAALVAGRIVAEEGGQGGDEQARPPVVMPGVYVGAETCKECHFKKHRTWKKSHHPGAFDVLPPKYRADPACLNCHTTGYGQKGGFVSHEQTPEAEGVQCEMCRGPGTAHATFMTDNEKKQDDPAIIDQGIALLDPRGGVAGARAGCYRCHFVDSHGEHPKVDR